MPTLEDEDYFMVQINERNEKSLIPLMEDVAEWLSTYICLDINVNNFLDMLDDGVALCMLAIKIQKLSKESKVKSKILSNEAYIIPEVLPPFEFNFHHQVKKKSFFARENAENFLKWCRKIGIRDSTLFVSEDLVLHKQTKNIILTLLELGRIVHRYGIEVVPSIVNLEIEIEEENQNSFDWMRNVTIRKKKRCKTLDLDAKVQRCARKYNVAVEKISEGKYLINKKLSVFIRTLRSHIMVRVGGGWDELDSFLNRHNPDKQRSKLSFISA
ncbi:GAS2-like protein pickled eggs isoform X1 [Hydra vulgaris]|uniref:GAS2-like protein pickled eggs isoform X1 n=1 Tax=Hydra vulgaris TaxID=6087 RepID=UPI000641802B|nr:GAS2-like protein pickled eggs [Hydra vulgaris]